MTIAIGKFCDEGLLIAADTQAVMSDGTTRDRLKVNQAITDTGAYVTANATEDGNAANTLIPDMLDNLQNKDPKSFAQVEKIVRASMSEWAGKYPKETPYTQILLGASINRPRRSDIKAGGGLQLYLCEPPNTMFSVKHEDANGGYYAIGAGASVTDLIYPIMPGARCSANTALHQIAYLMYRAKKDAAAYCGGQTTAVLLKNEFSKPLWVRNLDMQIAEGYGEIADFALKMATCALYAETDGAAATIWESVKQYFANQGKLFRSHRFVTDSGEDVGLPPLATPSVAPPEENQP